MIIEQVLTQFDRYTRSGQKEKAEAFLTEQITEAMREEDTASLIVLLNEAIGFFRDICQYEKAILFGEKALMIAEDAGLMGTIHYATTLLNLATSYRAGSRFEDAISTYMIAEKIYEQVVEEGTYPFASLWNNLSLVYMEKGDYSQAIFYQKKAIDIVSKDPGRQFELAVSRTNLGNCLLECGDETVRNAVDGDETDTLNSPEELLQAAIDFFDKNNIFDTHYAAAIVGMGKIADRKEKYEDAASCYEKAMETIRSNFGFTEYYFRVQDYYRTVTAKLEQQGIIWKGHMQMSGLELAEAFAKEHVIPMLQKNFSEVAKRATVGLVGRGSDCYGFDDAVSRDHDWGPGCIIWLSDEDYGAYGKAITDAYEALPTTFMGYTRMTTTYGGNRIGVRKLSDFVAELVGEKMAAYLLNAQAYSDFAEDVTEQIYLSAPEYGLAELSNGKIFADGDGRLAAIREVLKNGYPRNLALRKLAEECAKFAQDGQYNFRRILQRGEGSGQMAWSRVSAQMILMSAIRHACGIVYLLNDRFMPHEKWQLRGCMTLDFGSELLNYVNQITELSAVLPKEKITDADCRQICDEIDALAAYLQSETAKRFDFDIDTGDCYMESTAYTVARIAQLESMSHEQLVDTVVLMEWKAFDKVKNEGGRANCQDNWNTFKIMRSSQYLVWTNDMLRCYAIDFESAMQRGWNPITEKYGRMEESTAPEAYAKIKDSLPAIPQEKKEIMEEIIRIQVSWMEEFAKDYPGMSMNARVIHTSEDTEFDTSYETYLRGEMGTYSDEMLSLYGAFIVDIAKKGENLAYKIMEQTALLYGYKSLADAESKLNP